MDSINSFITLRDRKGDSDDDIINLLIENFPKEIPTREKAVNIIGDWYQEMQMKIDTYGDKKRIVESNPGFETKIKSVIYSDGQYLVITMDNINNIQYLEYISIYINSLLKLILKSPSIKKLKTEIDKICSKKLKKQDEIDQVKDIKAMTEQSGPVRFGETAKVILELETDSEEDDDDEDEELSTDSDDDDDDDDEEDETAVIAIPEKSVTVPEKSPKPVITKIPDIAADLPTKQDDTPSPKTDTYSIRRKR